jgi:RNA polymerase sigma-70 factor (ECF subfamily)
VQAGDGSADTARVAFGDLAADYWYPLYAYLRRRGIQPASAEDLVQGFFVHLLAGNRLQSASQDRGRFRSFLLASLRNFMSNDWRAANAEKRGGQVATVSVDFGDAEQRYAVEPVDFETPQQLYDRRWALTLMDHALTRVREHYCKSGKQKLFDSLKLFLAGGDDETLGEIAVTLEMTPSALSVALHRLRKRCRNSLRAEVARTLESNDDLDNEVSILMSQIG